MWTADAEADEPSENTDAWGSRATPMRPFNRPFQRNID